MIGRSLALLVGSLLAASCATGGGGQGEAPAEGATGYTAETVVVLTLHRCAPERLEALRSFFRTTVVPALRREVEEGRLTDWRLLSRDEDEVWNFVVVRSAASEEAFDRSHRALVERVGAGAMDEAHAGCEEVRDEVFRLVAGQDDVQLRMEPQDPVP